MIDLLVLVFPGLAARAPATIRFALIRLFVIYGRNEADRHFLNLFMGTLHAHTPA